ncbi:MAG: CocE/NonD family hydrolase [Phocaeicola dorei]|nr:CocE/NonD family hydrolase [Phocaeicola dorei]
MKQGIIFFAMALIISFTQLHGQTAYPGGKWEPGPQQYDYTMLENIPVKMQDGVTLMADMSYPVDLETGKHADGKFPVIVEFTPYVGLGTLVKPMTYFTEHGYIVAVVRVRGTGKSEGEVQLNGPQDMQDCKDVLNWAATLEGSDGRVAFIGCSYPAGMALMAAAGAGKDSPLKAIVAANNALESTYRECWLVGGVPTAGFANYSTHGRRLFGNTEAAHRFFDRVRENITSGDYMAYDGAYWKEKTTMESAVDIVQNNVPVLLWSGFQDILDVPAYRTYIALQNAYAGRPVFSPMEKGQKVSPRYQMIMGEWPHADALDLGIYLQWIETWLKGTDTGLAETKKPLHLFEGGSNRWFNTDVFPIVERNTSFYLSASGDIQEKVTDEATAQLVWSYPSDEGGILVYETPALSDEIALAGPFSLTLYASSSNTNLEIIANLYDILPDGSTSWISRGIVLGSLREVDEKKSWRDANDIMIWPWQKLEKDDYMIPDQVYELNIPIAPRQWLMQTGHKLRLELTCQSPKEIVPPGGVPNSNSDDPGYLTAPQKATVPGGVYTLRFGKGYPSALHLPVIPSGSFQYVQSGIVPTGWNENVRKMEESKYILPLNWAE